MERLKQTILRSSGWLRRRPPKSWSVIAFLVVTLVLLIQTIRIDQQARHLSRRDRELLEMRATLEKMRNNLDQRDHCLRAIQANVCERDRLLRERRAELFIPPAGEPAAESDRIVEGRQTDLLAPPPEE